eukprot:4580330-Amphidinium_carterae.1
MSTRSAGHGNGCFSNLLNAQGGSGRENWRNQPYYSSRGPPPLIPWWTIMPVSNAYPRDQTAVNG